MKFFNLVLVQRFTKAIAISNAQDNHIAIQKSRSDVVVSRYLSRWRNRSSCLKSSHRWPWCSLFRIKRSIQSSKEWSFQASAIEMRSNRRRGRDASSVTTKREIPYRPYGQGDERGVEKVTRGSSSSTRWNLRCFPITNLPPAFQSEIPVANW